MNNRIKMLVQLIAHWEAKQTKRGKEQMRHYKWLLKKEEEDASKLHKAT